MSTELCRSSVDELGMERPLLELQLLRGGDDECARDPTGRGSGGGESTKRTSSTSSSSESLYLNVETEASDSGGSGMTGMEA